MLMKTGDFVQRIMFDNDSDISSHDLITGTVLEVNGDVVSVMWSNAVVSNHDAWELEVVEVEQYED